MVLGRDMRIVDLICQLSEGYLTLSKAPQRLGKSKHAELAEVLDAKTATLRFGTDLVHLDNRGSPSRISFDLLE